MAKVKIRTYRGADRQACISIFDANCPEYFAPNERREYEEFLERVPGDVQEWLGTRYAPGRHGTYTFGLDYATRSSVRLTKINGEIS